MNLILSARANRSEAINLIEKDDGGSHEVCLPGGKKNITWLDNHTPEQLGENSA